MNRSVLTLLIFLCAVILTNLPSMTDAQGSVMVTSLTAAPELPVQYGTPITWTAVATGGTPPLQYQFWRRSDASGSWTLVRDYSEDASYTWTPGLADVGAYNLQVWVRSAGSTAAYEGVRSTTLFAITSGPPAIVSSVTAWPASPAAAGTPITWTAAASGGSGTLEYEFWRYCDTAPVWTQVRPYSISASYSWTPSASDVGLCYVEARVRTVGAAMPYESSLNSAAYVVTNPDPVSVTSVTPSPPSSAPYGTPVSWMAVATGGIAPLEYKFWRYTHATSTWVMARDYSTDPSHTWTPGAADIGTYSYQVWVRSAGSSATYESYRSTDVFTVLDVLQAPVATPGSGTYTPDQLISLSAQSGAELRYTVDGSDPSMSSPLYTAPLQLPLGTALLKARAYKTGWGPSPVATWTYQIRTEIDPPGIAANVSPAPNAAGWNNTHVQVTFTCVDEGSGIASCTPPVTVSQDGAAITVTAEAVDNAGNRTSTTVAVNVDRTAPVVTVHVPEDGDVVPPNTTEIMIKGNAADFTSGVALVTCSGVVASLEQQRYACNVPVNVGSNTIPIVAEDLAGNTTTKTVGVTLDNPPPPTAIAITPARMTLLPGQGRKLHVVDQRNRPVTGGTFTVADPLVAQVEIVDEVPYVRAVGGGETTVTLTRDALTAEGTVTVLPAGTTEIPNGTTIWALDPAATVTGPAALRIRGRVLRAVAQGTSAGGEAPALFYVEHDFGSLKPARAVATSWDGRVLWGYSRAEEVNQFAADNRGGLILKVGGDTGANSEYPGGKFLYPRQTVRRLDGTTGAVGWEYLCLNGELSGVAVHPDGTIYVVESLERSQSLLALDGDSGRVRARIPLTGSGRGYANATAPLVRQDGMVVVVAHRWKAYSEYEDPQTVLFEVNSDTVGVTEHEIDSSALTASQQSLRYGDVDRLLPYGDKLLVSVGDRGLVFRLDPDYTLSQPVDLRPDPYNSYPKLAPQFVVGPGVVHALVQSWPNEPSPVRPRIVRFSPDSMTIVGTDLLDQEQEQYLLHSVTANGTSWVTGPEWGNIQQVAPGLWGSVEPAVALRVDVEATVASTESPYWAGNQEGENAPPPVPLTTARLREIAAGEHIGEGFTGVQQNRAIGLAFQGLATWSVALNLSPPQGAPNTQKFYSPVRDLATDGVVKNVIPDIVANHFTIATGALYPQSAFFEVKAVAGTVTLSHSRQQIRGLLDIATLSPLGQSWNPGAPYPTVTFITTADTVIGADVVNQAIQSDVEVRQCIVEELAGGFLRVGMSTSFNAGRWLDQLFGNSFPLPTGRGARLGSRPGTSPADDPDPPEIIW